MFKNIMKIPEEMLEMCNLDDKFLDSTVQLVVGVLDAQTFPVDMRKLGFRDVSLHPRLQLLEAKLGVVLSFQ